MMGRVLQYWGYVGERLILCWEKSSIGLKVIQLISPILLTLWAGIGGLWLAVMVLLGIDVVLGTFTSIRHKKRCFASNVLAKGLLFKFLMYGTLFICAYVLEYIIKTSVPYTHFYIVGTVAAYFGFYECTSIVEHLITLFPDFPPLQKLAKLLNVWEKKIDKKSGILTPAKVEDR